MTTNPAHIVILQQERDITILTETVRNLCQTCQFDRIETEKLVLACSEIGHNAWRHGGGGQATLFPLKKGAVIRIIISDSGRGIPNIALALREGYSTLKTSLGLGLEGAQRLVEHFHITSNPTQGTEVIMEKYRPMKAKEVDYGLVSVPDDQYNYNGDQYILKEYDGDEVLLGVIDGPGQGYDAFSIAQSCKQFVESNYRKPLPELIGALNMLMQESNDEVGITCSLARLRPGKFSYLALGDSHAYISIDNKNIQSLTSQEGRIGYVTRVKDEVFECDFHDNVRIVLCTDGIKHIDLETLPLFSAQENANQLFDAFHRPAGDATILTSTYRIQA